MNAMRIIALGFLAGTLLVQNADTLDGLTVAGGLGVGAAVGLHGENGFGAQLLDISLYAFLLVGGEDVASMYFIFADYFLSGLWA